MISINIYTFLPDIYFSKFKYVVENIFNIYDINIVIIKGSINNFNKEELNIIYVAESYENAITNIYSEAIVVRLKNRTLKYFSHFVDYDEKEVRFINNIPCIFPEDIPDLFPFDLFAASFFFLSCWQEYYIKEKDNKGRVQLRSTLQHKYNCIKVPLVNEYLLLLEDKIKSLYNISLPHKKIKNNSNKVALISHDIDHLNWESSEYKKRLINHTLSKPYSLKNITGSIYNNSYTNRFKIFNEIDEIEWQRDCKSTFFFLSDYPLEDELEDLCKIFDSSKFELAHHISDKSIYEKDLERDKSKFSILNNAKVGERVHTLRFNIYDLFKQIEEYGYLYDSSLLFAENLGYRTGFSFPHYIYNPIEEKTFGTLAISPNVMETSVFEKKYLGKNERSGYNYIIKFINESKHYPGYLSILFHHSFFWLSYNARIKGFKKMMDYIQKQEIPFMTHKELYIWYVNNSLKLTVK